MSSDLYEIQGHAGLEYYLHNIIIISDSLYFSCGTFCAFKFELGEHIHHLSCIREKCLPRPFSLPDSERVLQRWHR